MFSSYPSGHCFSTYFMVFSYTLLWNTGPQHLRLLSLLLNLLSLWLCKFPPHGALTARAKNFQVDFPNEFQTCTTISLLGHLHLDEHLECNLSKSGLVKPVLPQAFINLEKWYHHAREWVMLEAWESFFTRSFLSRPRSIHYQGLPNFIFKTYLVPIHFFPSPLSLPQ